MTDRPIIFSAPMVQALLAGRKTQTRRVLDNKRGIMRERDDALDCVRFYVGDRLWVRESYQQWPPENLRADADRPRLYRATDPEPPAMDIPSFAHHWQGKFRWRPSIHMPRWASRLTLTFTDVRVQRLLDISEADAEAEGIERLKSGRGFYDPTATKAAVHLGEWTSTAKQGFSRLWNSLHGDDAWDANPWVVALTFTVQRSNIDQLGAVA